mmetsp:Transcript_65424/g.129526  ORF Transcript_65424/g.129526 Transcript_65424/m.129526 type:complete len:84 (-) Transcript_65424:164-415(-)
MSCVDSSSAATDVGQVFVGAGGLRLRLVIRVGVGVERGHGLAAESEGGGMWVDGAVVGGGLLEGAGGCEGGCSVRVWVGCGWG